jgi:pimeloyl-ACP methyl ester carboxylesterase
MKKNYRYAHMHGFASSPLSRKGTYLAKVFESVGIRMELPDLNRPSFSKLTYTSALSAMDELDNRKEARWRITGSSMGGYLAARWAELHPRRMDKLVLLCPGFNMGNRWPDLLGEETMERWKKEGSLAIPDAVGKPVAVHYAFIEEARKHPPWPEVPCPTLIVHGTRDETVPVENSRRYAASRPSVRLVEVDDDHALIGSLDLIVEETLNFFGIKSH